MKFFVIGANGYVGSEIFYTTQTHNYKTIGTYATRPAKELVQFRVEDQATWKAVNPDEHDVVIWAAITKNSPKVGKYFTRWLQTLPEKTVFIYMSSDITLCSRALRSKKDLGDYAREKLLEQNAALARPNSICFTIGPVFGTNNRGEIDKRTEQLLESSAKQHKFWGDVYKTFVPIEGLIKTLFENLDKHGHYFIGPPIKQSFFDFYSSRAEAHGMKSDSFVASVVSDEELEKLGQCRDISYGDRPNRLWVR